MTALSNPGRAVPWDADAPTRAAAETVLRRDNVISLIAETDLLNEWERSRVPILKFKDWLRTVILRHQPTPDEKLENLATILESKMLVEAGPVGDGTVTIKLWWPDAEVGYRVVQAAEKAFLGARQVAETTAISESIGILERYSASLHQNINRTLAQLQSTQATRRAAAAKLARSAPSTRAWPAPVAAALTTSLTMPSLDPTSSEPDTELNKAKALVTAKRQELARLEDARESQLAALQSQLAQLTTVYTASHPSVMAVQQNIEALKHEPTQLASVKADLQELEAEYDRRSAEAADEQIRAELARRAMAAGEEAHSAPVAESAPATPPPATSDSGTGPDGPDIGTLLLRSELSELESVLQRTDGARIELAVSQAAFKYRYTVIQPARVPREAIFPNLRLIVGGGFVASLLFALIAVVSKDLLSNRILEAWQVQRQLGLPILGTVRLG